MANQFCLFKWWFYSWAFLLIPVAHRSSEPYSDMMSFCSVVLWKTFRLLWTKWRLIFISLGMELFWGLGGVEGTQYGFDAGGSVVRWEWQQSYWSVQSLSEGSRPEGPDSVFAHARSCFTNIVSTLVLVDSYLSSGCKSSSSCESQMLQKPLCCRAGPIRTWNAAASWNSFYSQCGESLS